MILQRAPVSFVRKLAQTRNPWVLDSTSGVQTFVAQTGTMYARVDWNDPCWTSHLVLRDPKFLLEEHVDTTYWLKLTTNGTVQSWSAFTLEHPVLKGVWRNLQDEHDLF